MISIIFPIKCIKCRCFINEQNNEYTCNKCFKLITIKKSFECVGCKRSIKLGETCLLCRRSNYLDQLLIASDYTNPLLAKLIKIFKYNFIYDVRGQIFLITKKYLNWMIKNKKYDPFSEEPLVIPVPLHKRRLNFRGFNQSEIMASLIADNYGLMMRSDVLLKTKKSKSQADIKEREERLENIAGVFKVVDQEKIKGRVVLLIDDICTTGATLNECARVLKESGATKVIALVVARG